MTNVLIKRENQTQVEGRLLKRQGEDDHLQAKEKDTALGRTQPGQDSTLLLVKPPSLWYIDTAASEN